MGKREILLIVLALILAGAISGYILFGQTLETGAWGLSFREDGAAPIGPASAAQLAQYGAAYLGDAGEKVIYLTFDAGYENGCTAKILDILKKHQVPAAFFLAGNYMQKNPDLVRRMADEGHTVGNHTMHHPDMSQISDPAAFQKELEDLEKLYLEVTGQQIGKFYRPPKGLYSQENLRQAQLLGYKTVFWSLAHVDWNQDDQPAPEEALHKLLGRIHPGAVVLLHSTSQTNAAILDEFLTKLKEMGYEFAPIQELFTP